MDRKTRWRTFWLALLTVVSVLYLLPTLMPSRLPVWFPFEKKIQLGLDLQGGLHIVYGIDLDKAVDDKSSEIKRDLDTKLAEQHINARVSTPRSPLGGVEIIASTPQDLKKIQQKSFLSDYDDIVVPYTCPTRYAGKAVCVRVSSDYADGIKSSAIKQAIKTIRERIDERGIASPDVVQKGDQIIVELPGLSAQSTDRVKGILERTAKLEFKIVDNDAPYMRKLFAFVAKDPNAKEVGIGTDEDSWTHEDSGKHFNDYYLKAKDRMEYLPIAEAKKEGCYNRNMAEKAGKVQCTVSGRTVIENYLDQLAKDHPEYKIDDDHQFGYEQMRPYGTKKATEPTWRTYYLHRAVELGGTAVSQANVVWNPTTNTPEVLVEFNRWGARRFGDLTSKNVGRKMAIILDDRINSAPVIQSAITGGRSTITMGGGSAKEIQVEAQDLVNVLRTGALPAPLKEDSSSQVGPLLGQDSIRKAELSFVLGTILVILLMVGIYRRSGMISILALGLNILFMLAILAAFQATLTLPGIAAVVLTVGMAVDANVIIYERMREELRAGKSVRGAVDAGFSRAFSAILDGNLTTAAAGYVLYEYGSGPIRGFAVMLIIGIATTLFTTTWCTRLFFEYYVGRGRKATEISI